VTRAIGSLSLFSVPAHGEPQRLGRAVDTGASGEVIEAALTPDAKRLTTVQDDGSATVWDLSRPTAVEQRATVPLESSSLMAAAVSPDGTRVATTTFDDFESVRLTDLTDPGAPKTLAVLPETPGDRLTISPDGHTLVAISVETVTLWDITNPRDPSRLTEFELDEQAQLSTFSPDGRTLAFATRRNVTLYDLADKKKPELIGKLKGHTGDYDETVALWNIADHSRLRRQAFLTDLGAAVWSVAFAPDGHTLAIGTDDNAATMWDVTEPSGPVRVATVKRTDLKSKWLLFHPDKHTLTTSGPSESTTRAAVWDYSALNDMRANPAAVACAAAGSGLAADDWAVYIPELEFQKTCP
jgi:hypothetical protein